MADFDGGPAIRRARGELVDEWRCDPDRPGQQVRGARARDSLREMYWRDRITETQWNAAERLRNDVGTVLAGGVAGMQLAPRAHTAGGGAGWLPGDAVLAARRRLRETEARLGPEAWRVVELSVIGDLTLAGLGRALRCAKVRAAIRLRDALNDLVECYNPGSPAVFCRPSGGMD